MFESFLKDLSYATRGMRRNPAFAATAVITLGLGIGGNTAMFTIIRNVMLRPLPYRDPDRLVYFSLDNAARNSRDVSFSQLRLDELRAAQRSFTAVGAFLHSREEMTLSGAGEPEALKGARVSANFLDILGVPPLLGRGFLPEEDAAGGPHVAILGEALWRRRFGADPLVVGNTATLDATPYAIVGVLPAWFDFPMTGVDVWVPRPSEWSILAQRFWGIPVLTGFARLRPGVSLDQARAEMDVLNGQYVRAHPNALERDSKMHVVLLKDRLVANIRAMLWTLAGAVGFVLLIACANVASLLMARASSRSREFAVRASLGAARGRLIRQLLAESLLLASAGGIVGIVLAQWAVNGIKLVDALSVSSQIMPLSLPAAGQMRLDGAVLAFTLALTMVTGVVFGLFPALGASRPDVADALRASGEGAGRATPRKGVSARGLLVVGQIALSMVLLIGAALLIESFARLHNVNPGFEAAHLLTMKIALPPARYDTAQKRAAFFSDLAPLAEASPGVESAAVAMSLPATTWIRTNITGIEGQPAVDSLANFAVIQSVTPGYFKTLGITLRRGREFTARDNVSGARPAVIVNEALARRLWPEYPRGLDPVGQHIGEGYDKQLGGIEVVGVVADVHEGGLAYGAVPEFYLPVVDHPPQTAYLVVRAEGDPLRLANAMRSQVWALDRDQAVSDVRTMENVFEASMGQRRWTMVLLGGFAGVALLLAMVGIYGVIAYSVAERTQEVGIRRALGARHRDILRLVLGQALGLAISGVAIGIGGSLALTRVIGGLLFQVTATDPATYMGIALLFVAIALAASYVPARRATRIDPMAALR